MRMHVDLTDLRGWAKELSIGRPCSKGSTSSSSSMRKKDLDRELVRVVSNYSTTLSKEDPKRACCTERAASQNDLDGLDGDTIFAEEDRGAYCYVHGSLQHILKSYSETKERSTFQNSLRRRRRRERRVLVIWIPSCYHHQDHGTVRPTFRDLGLWEDLKKALFDKS